ncbi:MAG TPA: DUF4252 domain-containing protein, partial [Cryomorphaceae bacterium]|nr:DUF4252 domain-containing protein [Cryomorphaceae bacterium]
KIFLSIAALAMTFSVMAQDAIDRYFSKYADNPDFTSITISSKMFGLFSDIETDDPDNKEVLNAMKDLTGIRIISNDDSESMVDYQKAIKEVGKEYEILMSVDDKEEKVRFFVREEAGQIAELFMIVGGKGHLFLMSISGIIDLEKISKISKNMNIGGMDYLENLDEDKKTN